MTGHIFNLITILIFTVVHSTILNKQYNESLPFAVVRDLRRRVLEQGCDANICFALDGSGSISEEEFKLSRHFAQDIVSILADRSNARYGGNQFGRTANGIARLTKDRTYFATAMENEKFLDSKKSNMGAGIRFCDKSLAGYYLQANKIVVISDGRNRYTGNPVQSAKRFKKREPNGRITSVVVGGHPDYDTLNDISDNPVLTVDEYIKLGVIITDLVRMVCGIE